MRNRGGKPARSTILRTIVLALLLLVLAGGCGYRPVVQRGPLADANGVDIVLFTNKSFRSGVEGVLARDLIDEFALRTGQRVLPGDKAQLDLSGTVLSYTTTPVSYNRFDAIQEYAAALTVQATLREKRTQKVLWKGELTEQQVYPVNANIALQQNAEEAAIAKVTRRLAERIWQKIGERF
ncbi:LPS-assembly lipoprotein LptE [Citrifermentans bremense]|uniref:LPS-assembly lipoprotein LptE n=1 Tax=Citrifermentans bremense TaxID=60035 RepID=A0A6S6LXJ8_9BACT|nr:LptE family protein [Citrifermentans bremense]BCG46008.1 LPS-assembly lipoprotein LptE [Citrifermentans bremense]